MRRSSITKVEEVDKSCEGDLSTRSKIEGNRHTTLTQDTHVSDTADRLGREMKSRRKARESVLQALYQCDTLCDYSVDAIDVFFEVFHPRLAEEDKEEDAQPEESNGEEYIEFSRSLLEGVIINLDGIDEQITSSSTHWSIARMSRVDRNILRLATYEFMFCADIPFNVTINEAIEISKRFGTDDSPMFINGVLDNIAKILENDPRLSEKIKSLGKKRLSA